MKFTVGLLVASLAVITKAWNLPKATRKVQIAFAKCCATAAACAALAAPAQAVGDAAIHVDINAPFVLDLVKTKDAREQTLLRAEYIVESIKSLVGPAVSVELPSDVQGFVKKALSGGATVAINGQDVSVQVVQSQSGSLTVQLSNKFIPAIPFAGLDTTPAVVNAVADKVAEAAPGALELVQKTMNGKDMPFWDQPIGKFRFDFDVGAYSVHRPVTLIDIVGTSSLGLGAVYAGSFAYYKYEQDQEAKTAEAKKQAMAEKRAAAAAVKKKSDETKTATKAAPEATKESEPFQQPKATTATEPPAKPAAPQVSKEPVVALEDKVLVPAEATASTSSAEEPPAQPKSRRLRILPRIMLRRSS